MRRTDRRMVGMDGLRDKTRIVAYRTVAQ